MLNFFRKTWLIFLSLVLFQQSLKAENINDHEKAIKAVNEGEILPLNEILKKITENFYGRFISINLKDNDNGILSGKFKTLEVGKFSINFGNITKEFYIGISNNIEAEYVKSSEKLLKDYFENNNQYMYSISWIQDNIPKIAKVYNKNNISGKNWIGFLEKKIEKNDISLKKELLNWIFFMPFLLLLFFVCWFRDAE